MTYTVDAAELTTVVANAQSGAEIYGWILNEITDANGDPKAGVDDGVWVWMRGALDVNSGIGSASEFIRTYTERQYFYRYGLTDLNPQENER